jgi:DNA-binding MarR family transcriptional regulator
MAARTDHADRDEPGRSAARSGRIGSDKAPSTLAFLLSQVGIYASRRFAQRIAALDLQPPLFRVLNVVDAAEGQSQQAIGEAIQAPASRMVAIVDELERRGLIQRRPHPSDRRIRTLYLTDEGRELLARGRKIAMEHEQELTRGMNLDDRKHLIALLQKIVEEQGIGSGVHPGLGEPRARK